MKNSVKAMVGLVKDIEAALGAYAERDVIENNKDTSFVRSGFKTGTNQFVSVATVKNGYDDANVKKMTLGNLETVIEEVSDKFGGMSYSPQRDKVVSVESIISLIRARVSGVKNVEAYFRKKEVNYVDTIDVVLAATDAKSIVEVSFKGDALYAFDAKQMQRHLVKQQLKEYNLI